MLARRALVWKLSEQRKQERKESEELASKNVRLQKEPKAAKNSIARLEGAAGGPGSSQGAKRDARGSGNSSGSWGAQNRVTVQR